MLFNSFEFAGLLIITFLLYYIPRLEKAQVLILSLSSLVFYAFNQPILVFLLLTSALINILASYYVAFTSGKFKKIIAIMGVAANLLILFFFKYSPLFAKTFFNSTSSVGEFLITIPLPVGISFFTFQGISLVVDVFTERYFSNKDLIPRSFIKHANRILFFKAFFPQLVAGPIMKAHDFIPQINRFKLKEVDWQFCFKSLVLGYFLKMVVADNLKDYTFWIEYPYFQGLSTLTLLFNLIGYSCQIFADFAGYSLIALGLAGLFGYKLIVNFNFPYISSSFSEFWRRWHISLSSFLKEYLYIPLGGNKNGKVRTYINLMITMLLGGLWHGAAWSYMIWGGFHGLALAVERLINDNFKIRINKYTRRLKIVMVFTLVTLAWLLFKLPDFNHVIIYFQSLFTNIKYPNDPEIITYITIYSLPVMIYHFIYIIKDKLYYLRVREKIEYSVYGLMMFMIVVNSGSAGSFIYFQF